MAKIRSMFSVNVRRWIGSLFVGPRGFIWLIFPIQRRKLHRDGVYRLDTRLIAMMSGDMKAETAMCRVRTVSSEHLR